MTNRRPGRHSERQGRGHAAAYAAGHRNSQRRCGLVLLDAHTHRQTSRPASVKGNAGWHSGAAHARHRLRETGTDRTQQQGALNAARPVQPAMNVRLGLGTGDSRLLPGALRPGLPVPRVSDHANGEPQNAQHRQDVQNEGEQRHKSKPGSTNRIHCRFRPLVRADGLDLVPSAQPHVEDLRGFAVGPLQPPHLPELISELVGLAANPVVGADGDDTLVNCTRQFAGFRDSVVIRDHARAIAA